MNRIKEFRKMRGMTQQELADKAGIDSRNNLASLESGVRAVSPSQAERIAKVLDVSVSELLGTDIIKSSFRHSNDLKGMLASSLKEASSSFEDMIRTIAELYSYRLVSRKPKEEELAKDYEFWQVIYTILSNYNYLSSNNLESINKITKEYVLTFCSSKREDDIKKELFSEDKWAWKGLKI